MRSGNPDPEIPTQKQPEKTCPFCGTKSKKLPLHITECDSV